MKKICFIILSLMLHQCPVFSQVSPVNRQLFFLDDTPVEVTLTTDIRKLRSSKKTSIYQPADIMMRFSDTLIITEVIRVQLRGIYRKNNCDLASLMFNFKNTSSPKLSPLKKLKFVGPCRNNSAYEELLLKEYLVYKIHNMLSNMSFRVRLLHITYNDSKQKVKPYTTYAFLVEDISDLAARNNCVENKNRNFFTEATNRDQMTFVNLFQYMIGNTDWSIQNLHNMKLIVPKNDTLARPYAIPYDFDFCGLVNADYAVPTPALGIESVQERLYRGFPRSLDEIYYAIDLFKEKKESILYYIDHFELCNPGSRKGMTAYLNQFYRIISNKKSVEAIFILGARTQ